MINDTEAKRIATCERRGKMQSEVEAIIAFREGERITTPEFPNCYFCNGICSGDTTITINGLEYFVCDDEEDCEANQQ